MFELQDIALGVASANESDIGIGFKIGGLRVANPPDGVGHLSDGFLDFEVEFPGEVLDGIGDDWLRERESKLYHIVLVVDDLLFVDCFFAVGRSHPH